MYGCAVTLLILAFAGIVSGYQPQWHYKGCYLDTVEVPLFMDIRENIFSHWSSKPNGPHHCTNKCAQMGFQWAGLKNGAECHCARVTHKLTQSQESVCDMECPKLPGENHNLPCGGKNAMSLYRNEAPCDWQKIGMFGVDDNSLKSLFRTAVSDRFGPEDAEKVVPECQAECDTMEMATAGVVFQASKIVGCYCGYSFTPSATQPGETRKMAALQCVRRR